MSSTLKCPMVVSVSRRCDIPRYNFDWFMERLNKGYVDVKNPFNAGQVRRVSLTPCVEAGITGANAPCEAETVRTKTPCVETPGGTESPALYGDGVDFVVFWTRDPRNILAYADELEKRFPFYVMATITHYPKILEPYAPDVREVCLAMKSLSEKIGPERVIWRYDPVFVSTVTDADFHRRNFSDLARNLSNSSRRVIVSLYKEYKKSKQRLGRLEKEGLITADHSPQALAPLFKDIAGIAHDAGMEIQSCAQESLDESGINPGACIDSSLISRIAGFEISGRDKNQRPGCLCCQSVDIGVYGACKSGCVYCYAS